MCSSKYRILAWHEQMLHSIQTPSSFDLLFLSLSPKAFSQPCEYVLSDFGEGNDPSLLLPTFGASFTSMIGLMETAGGGMIVRTGTPVSLSLGAATLKRVPATSTKSLATSSPRESAEGVEDEMVSVVSPSPLR